MSRIQNTQVVQAYIKANNINTTILTMPTNTHTSKQAAEALECDLRQIAKSIVFRLDQKPLLFLVSGPNRVDLAKVSKLLNQTHDIKLQKADADFVYQYTGFPIGGMPPFAHKQKLDTFVDEDLKAFDEVWCAGGSDVTLFKIRLDVLLKLTQAQVVELKE